MGAETALPRGRWRPSPLVAGSAGLHLAAAATVAAVPEHWPLLAATLFADHCVIAGTSLWPQSRLLGPNLSRLPAAAARRGEVALTFDDGPDPAVTPRVLDLLEQAGAGATFFLIGRRAAAWPDLAAEIVRRGHRVGNHTQTHPHGFAMYGPRAMAREVVDAQETLERTAGERPALFRAPAGFRNPFLDWILWRQGLTLASWTRRGYDTVERDPGRVARRLLRNLSAGDVLLLHDGSAAPTLAARMAGRPAVLEALPAVLDALAGRGLRAVPFEAETAAVPRRGGPVGKAAL
jgi:peptidoglycan/xylan/chitin deacetylase (PgdA/CDA1 family)